MSESLKWTRDEAISMCRLIEHICPAYACHVALTGGLLYKEGARKDCDILFYRIRQANRIDTDGLTKALDEVLGMKYVSGFGWCFKFEYKGKQVDAFFPEEVGGNYNSDPNSETAELEIIE